MTFVALHAMKALPDNAANSGERIPDQFDFGSWCHNIPPDLENGKSLRRNRKSRPALPYASLPSLHRFELHSPSPVTRSGKGCSTPITLTPSFAKLVTCRVLKGPGTKPKGFWRGPGRKGRKSDRVKSAFQIRRRLCLGRPN